MKCVCVHVYWSEFKMYLFTVSFFLTVTAFKEILVESNKVLVKPVIHLFIPA